MKYIATVCQYLDKDNGCSNLKKYKEERHKWILENPPCIFAIADLYFVKGRNNIKCEAKENEV